MVLFSCNSTHSHTDTILLYVYRYRCLCLSILCHWFLVNNNYYYYHNYFFYKHDVMVRGWNISYTSTLFISVIMNLINTLQSTILNQLNIQILHLWTEIICISLAVIIITWIQITCLLLNCTFTSVFVYKNIDFNFWLLIYWKYYIHNTFSCF